MGIISIIAAFLSMTTHCFIRLTLLLAGLFTVFNVLSQKYNYIHYDTKDGLAGSTVHDVIQARANGISYCPVPSYYQFKTCEK